MASKRAQRKKACSNKHRFNTSKQATDALFSFKRRKSDDSFLTVYNCQFCGGFHYGHTPANVRQGIAASARSKGPIWKGLYK